MKARPLGWLFAALLVGGNTAAFAGEGQKAGKQMLYDFKMKNIDGQEVGLDQYKGKVVLVVNVASKCGLTPHYEGLQKLYEKYGPKGLVILGFPANEFGAQEPGTNAEIKTFCSTRYGVTFPMFAKIVVKGKERHPLYTWLVQSSGNPAEIEWNFAKFLIGKNGQVVERFNPQTTPDALAPAIEKLLAGA